MHSRRVWPAILLGLLLLLAFRGVFSGRLFYLRDVSQNHYPVRALVTERLRSGSLPLWDPFHGGGTPLLANPNALVLHPITLLFFVLPFDAAFVASIVLQFALLAAGGYLLGRVLGLGRPAALLVAAVLSLSGPAASLASLQNVLSAAAWVPIALWALLKGVAPGRRCFLALAALCTAVVLIAAEPASLLALVLVGLALAATEPGSTAGRGPNLPACLVFGAVLLVAVLVAAIEIVPAGALLPLTERGAGFGVAEGLKWSLLPRRLPELVMPGLFGDPTRLSPVSWWGGFLFEGRYPFLLSIYVGVIPALLACLGAWHGGAGIVRRRSLGIVAALGLLLALGRDSALYRSLFGLLPPLRQVRYPERFVLLFLLAFAILAGHGLERLLASAPSRRAILAIASVSVTAFAACACAATTRLADRFLAFIADVPAAFLAADGGAALRGDLLRSVLWVFGESVVLLALALWLQRRGLPSTAGVAAVVTVVLVSLSLVAAASPARSMAAAGWLTAPSPLQAVVEHGTGAPRLHHDRRPVDLSVRGTTDELVWGYRYDRFVYALMTGHADSVPTALDAATDRMDLKDGAELGRALDSLPFERRVRALAACRVGYVLSYDALDDPGLEPGPVLDGLSRPPARLYRLKDVVPRLRWVTRARRLDPGGDLATALSDPGYDPATSVLLDDGASSAVMDHASDDGLEAQGNDEAVVVQESPERISMRVEPRERGFLVLADSYAPGWQATLDGRPVPILRADGLFRAVAVPAGGHSVEMTYRPSSVVTGMWLGALGALLTAAFGLASRWKRW
jgi:membrane protein YfhO